MPGSAFAKGAAALCALAVFTCAWGEASAIGFGKLPLTIEVIAPQSPQSDQESMQNEEKSRVLIYHTHTFEAYEMTAAASYTPTETWRTKDETYNMIRVGEALAGQLRELGFEVVHDTTAFEPPNLSDAYRRSLSMLEARRAAGESYDYILDVHRDAYGGNWNGANSVTVDGQQAAYVMLLVGKGTGATGSGFDERPDWPKNLELAQRITDEMNTLAPGISREVKIKTGRFNQHVSTGALLIEVGNNMNTLDEALAACPVIAKAIAQVQAEKDHTSPEEN